jgi:agmatinase
MMDFLGVSDACCSAERAATRILPVPYEGTVSYGKGTGGGPQAVIEASQQVELYDECLRGEPWRTGIATLPALPPEPSPDRMVQAVEQAVDRLVAPGRLVVVLGGEHSLSSGAVAAHLKQFPEMGVIQFDAHADLRETYTGSPWNHACVMARIYERVASARCLQLGIRSLSTEEATLSRERDYRIAYARDIVEGRSGFSAALAALPRDIYITFDVDVFDPSIIRATGTPEPGGLDWYTVLAMLEQIFAEKRVVGFDVVELTAGDPVSAFTIARLVYRMVGLWAQSTGSKAPTASPGSGAA